MATMKQVGLKSSRSKFTAYFLDDEDLAKPPSVLAEVVLDMYAQSTGNAQLGIAAENDEICHPEQ